MSYALGIRTENGLVLAADSRTNAGADQVSTFRKLHVFERPGERLIALAVVGNLSLAQALLADLRGQDGTGGGKMRGSVLLEAASMVDAARSIGQAIRKLEGSDGPPLARHSITFDVTVLAGGQIGKEKPRLFQIYPAGNFIEASDDAPYFQIGERKYGKAILDQTVTADASLGSAVRAALLSFDATLQNNATVGLPIDLLALAPEQWRPAILKRYGADDPFFAEVRQRWSDGVKTLITNMPDPVGISSPNRKSGG